MGTSIGYHFHAQRRNKGRRDGSRNREKLARYLLETEVPVAITRHGDTIGYYIPARRKRSEAERTALKEAAVRLQQVLTAEGISEEEILNDFKQWRAGGRK
jgi:PHD/YefM family antitoxin component YafN of YafNO toxin-antitoxin module